MKFVMLAFAAVLVLTLTACAPPEPLKLGFLGGLSGRVADLGEAGRNGALLAVEEANAGGGVKGRQVELLIFDDAQNMQAALKAIQALVAAKVVAVIGPMTSAMGEAVLASANRAGLVLVSPTITASSLAGQDDVLFRVAPSVNEDTRLSAAHAYARGIRRVAAAYDLSNRAYTADWMDHFRQDFAALGGTVLLAATFSSGEDGSYAAALKQIAASRPDGLLLVANAVDTVRLTQLARNLGWTQPVMAATWAATEHLIELGGRTVEGMVLTQFFDRNDTSARYLAFAQAFRARFKQEPGFASVAAYDATQATLSALRAGTDQPLRQALISSGPFDGLQERWRFDGNGDAQRPTHLTVVRAGKFQMIQ